MNQHINLRVLITQEHLGVQNQAYKPLKNQQLFVKKMDYQFDLKAIKILVSIKKYPNFNSFFLSIHSDL